VIPLGDDQVKTRAPLVVWTLIALNVLTYLWDRHGSLLGPSITFADLTMIPHEVVQALHGSGDYFPLATIFTSMFLHAGLMHIIGNMIFLAVFGPAVEEALGSGRFALYYLAWGVAAAAAQIWVDPNTFVPTLGASGAIGGIMGAYLLMFPTSKIEIYIPILVFLSFELSAWILLGLWFVYQIWAPQQGVANWAHVGGFLAGMLTVLIMGGSKSILKGGPAELDH
jgi:membrane associated rhomboid family serine protease